MGKTPRCVHCAKVLRDATVLKCEHGVCSACCDMMMKRMIAVYAARDDLPDPVDSGVMNCPLCGKETKCSELKRKKMTEGKEDKKKKHRVATEDAKIELGNLVLAMKSVADMLDGMEMESFDEYVLRVKDKLLAGTRETRQNEELRELWEQSASKVIEDLEDMEPLYSLRAGGIKDLIAEAKFFVKNVEEIEKDGSADTCEIAISAMRRFLTDVLREKVNLVNPVRVGIAGDTRMCRIAANLPITTSRNGCLLRCCVPMTDVQVSLYQAVFYLTSGDANSLRLFFVKQAQQHRNDPLFIAFYTHVLDATDLKFDTLDSSDLQVGFRKAKPAAKKAAEDLLLHLIKVNENSAVFTRILFWLHCTAFTCQNWSGKADDSDLTIEQKFILGRRLYAGTQAQQNFSEANELVKPAADLGIQSAVTIHKFCEEVGIKAERDDDGDAQLEVAMRTTGETSFMWLAKAAGKGIEKAQCRLGLAYYKGAGITQDYGSALYWLNLVPTASDPEALCALGVMHYRGNGIKKNYRVAKEYFTKAAALKSAEATQYLGCMYLLGNGVNQDLAVAKKYFTDALALGHPEASKSVSIVDLAYSAKAGKAAAQYDLGRLLYYGFTTYRDEEKAVSFWEKAAKQNHPGALFSLGECYYFGTHVPKNMKKAKEYISRAAKMNHVQADTVMRKASMTPTYFSQ